MSFAQIERHPTRHTLVTRKRVIVNTDPQRRCYYGCNFSEAEVWTQWQDLYYTTKEDGKESMALYKSINPRSEYALLPPISEDL